MLNLFHKRYEFVFSYGQEGFELLYGFIIQPNSNYNVWFPQYSNKLWHGSISENRQKFDVKHRRQNSNDCEIIFDAGEELVIVETSISIFNFVPSLVFLIALVCIAIYQKHFDLGMLIPLLFIIASCFLPLLSRYEKIKSIKYNIRMVEHYLKVNKK